MAKLQKNQWDPKSLRFILCVSTIFQDNLNLDQRLGLKDQKCICWTPLFVYFLSSSKSSFLNYLTLDYKASG